MLGCWDPKRLRCCDAASWALSILYRHLVEILAYLAACTYNVFGANFPFCSAQLTHSFRCFACFLSAKFIASFVSGHYLYGGVLGLSDLASVHRSGGLVFHIFHIVSDISSDKWWPHQHPPPLLVHLSKPHESEMTLNNYASPRDQVPLSPAWIPFKSLRQINQLEASSICWFCHFFLHLRFFCTSALTSFF